MSRDIKGFTLVELMVVIVIIGVLAALAIPRFLGATAKAKLSEFKPVLKEIFTLQEIKFQEAGVYLGAGQESDLGFASPGAKVNFNYGILDGTGGAQTLGTATSKAGFALRLSDGISVISGGDLVACVNTSGLTSASTTLGMGRATQVAKDASLVDPAGTVAISACD